MEVVEFQGDFGAHRYAGFYTKVGGGREWAVDYDDETQTFIFVAHSEGLSPRARELIESIKQQEGFQRGDFSQCVTQACKRIDESVRNLRASARRMGMGGVIPCNTAVIILRSDRLVVAGAGALAVYLRKPNSPLCLLIPTPFRTKFLTTEMRIPSARALLLITDCDGEYENDQLRAALLKYDTPLQDLRYAAIGLTKERVGMFAACCCIQLHWQLPASSKAVRWADRTNRQYKNLWSIFNAPSLHKPGGDEEEGASSNQVL